MKTHTPPQRIIVGICAVVAAFSTNIAFGQPTPPAAPAMPAAPAAGAAAPAAAATPAYGANSFLVPVRATWEAVRTSVLDVAANVPEAKLDWRPGSDPAVRSFKQQLTHLAGENYLFFGQVSGDTTRPTQATLDALTTKAEIVKALTDGYTWAAAKFDALTEAQALEVVAGRGGRGGGGAQRWNSILAVIRDNMDHYGNLVTMMRANDIAPRTPRAGGRGGAGGGGGAPAAPRGQ